MKSWTTLTAIPVARNTTYFVDRRRSTAVKFVTNRKRDRGLNRGWSSAIAARFALPTAIAFLVAFARNATAVAPSVIAFRANVIAVG